MTIAVGMAQSNQRPAVQHVDTEFLAEFAHQAALTFLAGFEFSSGELPAAGEMPAGGSLSDQHTIIRIDDRTCDDVYDAAVQVLEPSTVGLLQRAVTVFVFLA